MNKKFFLGVLGIVSAFVFASCGSSKSKKHDDSETSKPKTSETSKEEDKSISSEESSTEIPSSSSIVLTEYTVSVTNSNDAAGSITGTGTFEEGTSVTLTAAPNKGYNFLGFYDADTKVSNGNELTYTFTLSSDVSLTAKWSVEKYTLTVSSEDEEKGTVSYEAKDEYETNEAVTLTATPEEGYQFDGWYIDGEKVETSATYEYKMLPQNTQIVAKFGVKQCKVQVVSNLDNPATYSLYLEDGGDEYTLDQAFDYGTTCYLKFEAEAGLSFVAYYESDENGDWGTLLSDEEVLEITLTESTQYIYVEFESESVDVTVSIDNEFGGVVSIDPEQTQYDYKSTITISVDLEDGFSFLGWFFEGADEAFETEEEFDYVVKYEGNNIIAKVQAQKVKVTFINDNEGLGTIVNESGDYDYMDTITLKAEPIEGYKFDGWFYDNGENPFETYEEFDYQIDDLADLNIHAKFSIDSFDVVLSKNIDAAGIITGADTYEYNTEITINATVVEGYEFVGWYNSSDIENEKDYALDGVTAVYTYAEVTFTVGAADINLTACYSRKQFTVRYVKGSAIVANPSKKVEYGADYVLDVPTLTGNTFMYWYYYDEELDEEIKLTNSKGESVAPYSYLKGIQVEPQWTTSKLKVTFEPNGGSKVDEQFIDYNTRIEEPANAPTQNGYTFAGWYDANGNVWNFNVAIVEDTTLYAHWNVNQYTLEVESIDDSIVTVNTEASGDYDYLTKVKLNATISDSGYSFLGWFVNDEEEAVSTEASFDYTIPYENVTIVAKYKVNQYKFTLYQSVYNRYSSTSETYATITGDGTYYYKDQVTITVNLTEGYHVYGYYNNGWIYDSSNARITDATYTFDMPSKDFSIRVYVITNTYSARIQKNTSYGTNPTFTVNSGSNVLPSGTWYGVNYTSALNLKANEIEGFTFKGWYDTTTNQLIATDATTLSYTWYMPKKQITIEARYEINSYNLVVNQIMDDNIDGNNDTTNLAEVELDYDDNYVYEVDEIEGYTFIGWFVQGENDSFEENYIVDFDMPSHDYTIYAKYTINTYEMYVEYETGNDPDNSEFVKPGNTSYAMNSTTEFDYNKEVTITRTATTDGYVWVGWFVDGVKVETADTYTFTMPADDVTVVATWKPENFTIKLDSNGGTLSVSSIVTGKFGEYFELPVPTKTDGEFTGWKYEYTYYVDDDIYNADIYLTDDTGVSEDIYTYVERNFAGKLEITVKATWGVKLEVVTFETGFNASTYASTDTKSFTVKVQYNSKVTKPENDPVRKGYTFVGWFTTDDEEGNLFDWTTTITEAKTIYAHWEINTYTVRLFNGNSGAGYFTYYVDDVINGTVTTEVVSLELEYGTHITLTAHCFIGRTIQYFTYRKASESTLYYGSGNTVWKNSNMYADDVTLSLYLKAIDSMKYYSFTSDDETCIITGLVSSYTANTSFTVPSIVTGIADGAFANATAVTYLELPFIGLSKDADASDRLFGAIFGKTSGTGKVSVTQEFLVSGTLTSAATRYIPGTLTEVVIYDEEYIPTGAFSRCTMLRDILLDCDIILIEGYAFYYTEITYLDLPLSLEIIDDYAFRYMPYLTSLYIPNHNLEYIGQGALANTKNIVELTIPFVGSGYNATDEEALLSWLYYGSNSANAEQVVQKYGDASNPTNTVTCNMPTALKVVNVECNTSKAPNYYAKVGAFMGMKHLTTITFNVWKSTIVEAYTFSGCESLEQIDSHIFAKAIYYRQYSFSDCKTITEIDIKNGGASPIMFNAHSFENCTALEEVKSEVGITSIASYAFNNCTSLSLISGFGSSVDFGQYALGNCTAMTSITVNNAYISSYAFDGCTALETFVVSQYYYYVRDYAFNNCTSLKELNINLNPTYTASVARTIGDGAFYGCSALKTITISDNAVSLGNKMFGGCSSLSNVTIPYVGKDANAVATSFNIYYAWVYFFDTVVVSDMNASTLNGTKYYIAKSVKLTLTNIGDIGQSAFNGVNGGISTVTITGTQNSDGKYKVGNRAFYYCFLSSITFAAGLTSIGDYAFYYSSLRSISLPNGLVSIGDYAFYWCSFTSSTTITLPNTVTTVGKYAFQKNSTVTKVILGTGITTIGTHAFDGCSNNITLEFVGTSSQFGAKVSGFAADWNYVSATLSILACKCSDTSYTIS